MNCCWDGINRRPTFNAGLLLGILSYLDAPVGQARQDYSLPLSLRLDSVPFVFMQASRQNKIQIVFMVLIFFFAGHVSAADVPINFIKLQDQEHQAAAQLTNNTVVFVYEDESSITNTRILMQGFTTNLGLIGVETRVNVSTNDERIDPTIAALTGGGFVVAYSAGNLDADSYAVAFRRYDANLVALDAIDVRANSISTGAQFHPQIARLTNGGFVIAWAGQNSVHQDIYYRRFNANGTAIDAADVLANGLGINSITNGDQGSPVIATLKDGGFVIAYEDRASSDVFGVVIDDSGTPRSAPGAPAGQNQFRINTATSYDQTSPSVAALTNGGFVVTYNSETDGASSSRRVLGRIFSATSVGGTEFQIGTHTNRWQSANVASLASGDFVVAWQAYGEGVDAETNSWAVFGQRFSITGAPKFLPIRLNTINTNDQDSPFVVPFNNGSYVISWESFAQDSNRDGVFASTFFFDRELLPATQFISRKPIQTIQIDVIGLPGRSYQLQGSTDFSIWSPVLTTNTASGNFFHQLPGNLPKRFFRVQSL